LLLDLERQRASRSWRRGALRTAVASLAVAAVLAGAGYYLFTRTLAPDAAGGRPPAPAQAIAFLPFENGTGKPALDWTRTGFPALVSNSLREAPDLRLLGGDRTQQTLADLKLPLSGTYTPFDLRRAGSVLGADVLISGVLRRAGDRFQAEARLQRPGLQGMQEIGVEKAEGQGEESIFALADALAGKIGGALKVRSTPARGQARSTTRSVEALRLYSEGLDLARAGRETEAAARLEQATGADPSFALAQALLSRIYARLGRRDRALAASDRAIQSLGGVTSHEARLIRARHAILQNRLDQGIAEYRELLRSFPQDTDARFDLAATLEQKGDLAAATEELQRCVLLDPKNTQARYILGRLRLRHGDSEEALKIFNDLLASYTQSGNQEGKGTVLLAIGNVHRYSSQYPEAIRYYRESLDIRRAIGDDRGMAAALGGIAKVLRVQGQSAEAIRSSREALDLLLKIGDQRGIAAEWRNLGEVYEDAGKILEAQKCYQESLKIVRDLDDPSLLADNFSSLGYVASALGNYVEAYFFSQEALAKRREIGDKAQVLRSLVDLGLLEQMQGRYEKALAYAAEAMDLVRETGEEAGGVVLATNVGMIHDDQGSYGAAIKSLAEAVERARRIDDKNLLASALLYLGGTLVRLGHLPEAEERLGEAERLVKETHTASLLPELLMGQAEVQGARGDFDRCLKTLEEALRQARSLGDRRLVILTRLTMGRWSLSENRPAGRSHLKWAEEEARKSALLPLRLRALAYLASASLKGPSTPDSIAMAGQVMGEGKALHLRESLVLASWVLARGALSEGSHKEATRMFLQAGQTAREMAEGLGEPYLSALLGRADLVKLSEEARGHISRHGSPAEGKEAVRLFPKTAG
ncbi:MAG: tetratricopeptide repeat protein, partial [Acidobacteria bacterium]|nr:tetratricopeptide repeat protein [Acidobacteriota bacterium]